MTQLKSHEVVSPYGEVNCFKEADGIRVEASILMKPNVENAQTGLAIDCSISMKPHFGLSPFGPDSPFGGGDNNVQKVGRVMADYLANFDSDGETTIVYWACGKFGALAHYQGDLNSDRIQSFPFTPPADMGTGTQLLPAVKYYTEEKFPDVPWAIYVFITDGEIDDVEAVKSYSLQIGREVSEGKRKYTKFVIIGMGDEFKDPNSKASQILEEIDDMDYGGLTDPNGDDIDLWDHKIAESMGKLEEIFAEVVSESMIIVPKAEILDSHGQPVKPLQKNLTSYGDGLPALLKFKMPLDSTSFTLRLPGSDDIIQTV
jgi:hypothetical protein